MTLARIPDRAQRVLVVLVMAAELLLMAVLRPTPAVHAGDEPHYLLTAHSVLFDFDLEVGDDYRSARAGGPEAGERFRGVLLDHHTLLFDPKTGEALLWSELYDKDHRPTDPRAAGLVAPIEKSAHPVAFAALISLFVALSGADVPDVEARFQLVVLLISFIGLVFTYLAARAAGLGRGTSLASTVVLLASPWLAYTYGYFSEAVAATFVVAGMWALGTRRLVLAAALLAFATAMKPALAVVGAAWVIARFLANDGPGASRLGAWLALFGSVLVAFNLWMAGKILLSGHNAWVWIETWPELFTTFVDLRYGLFVYAPWVLVGIIGSLSYRTNDPRRLAGFVLLTGIAVFLVVGPYGPLGGTAYACRYWIPILPVLAIGAAYSWRVPSRLYRASLVIAVVLAAVFAVPSAVRYRHHWDGRPADALIALTR